MRRMADEAPTQILSSDWTKTLHLQSDRSLELHTQSSSHYRVRMPRQGRTLAYHFPTCAPSSAASAPKCGASTSRSAAS